MMPWSYPGEALWEDCPPKNYPTDRTRCPRRALPIGSEPVYFPDDPFGPSKPDTR